MRVSHIRWSATVTKIYTKQRQKKPVRSQLRVSNELWDQDGDIVPSPAHLQPGGLPKAHTSALRVCRKSAGTLQGRAAFCNTQSPGCAPTAPCKWIGQEGKVLLSQPLAALSQTGADHIQGTKVTKRCFCLSEDATKGQRDALTGSSKDQGFWSFNHSNNWKGIAPGMNKGWWMKG